MRTVDPVRHAARRRHILEGAAVAFAERGFDNTTVKDLCSAAGVGSGTLFHYFADKRAVFHALLDLDRDTTVADLRAIAHDDPAQRLWAVVDRLTEDLSDPAAGAFMLAILGQLTTDPRVGEILGEIDRVAEEILRDTMEDLLTNGGATGWDAADAATWIRSIVDGLYLRCADDGFDPAAEQARLRLVLTRMLGLDPACG